MATDDDYNPFTDEDLEKLLLIERTESHDDGWKSVKKGDHLEVWRNASCEDSSIHLIKGKLHFKDIPPNAVADIVHDVESRKNWDKHFPVVEVLETHKHYRVVYWLCKMPIGVSDRDLVQNVSRRYDEATNTTYIMFHGCTHPSKPEMHGIVRAETILSGVIIRPDPDDPNSTCVTLMFQNDLKGLIPHAITNIFAAKAPVEWMDNLTKYYSEGYKRKVDGI